MALAAPLPTVTDRRRSRLWGIPVYWHLLSLDAPTVAVLWAWTFGRAVQVRSSISSLAVLGIGTWLIYVADRLIDGRFSPTDTLRERHFFHARHQRPFLLICAAMTVALLGLIRAMPPAARREDALVFAASMLYFSLVHVPALPVRPRFPRELAVGILFACAAAIPAWSVLGSPHAELVPLVTLFAALCCLNCVAIETWERSARPLHVRTISAIALSLAVVSAALVFVPTFGPAGKFHIGAFTFASAVLLFALDRLHRRSTQPGASPEDAAHLLLTLRIAADAALLTPLLFVLPWHL